MNTTSQPIPSTRADVVVKKIDGEEKRSVRVTECTPSPAWDRPVEIIVNKQLRVDLDAQLQKLKLLPPSRERAISITKLQEAIMWLGMDLKRLNEPNPYPDSYNPANTVIAPTADGL